MPDLHSMPKNHRANCKDGRADPNKDGALFSEMNGVGFMAG
jgi:hypothetical protein